MKHALKKVLTQRQTFQPTVSTSYTKQWPTGMDKFNRTETATFLGCNTIWKNNCTCSDIFNKSVHKVIGILQRNKDLIKIVNTHFFKNKISCMLHIWILLRLYNYETVNNNSMPAKIPLCTFI